MKRFLLTLILLPSLSWAEIDLKNYIAGLPDANTPRSRVEKECQNLILKNFGKGAHIVGNSTDDGVYGGYANPSGTVFPPPAYFDFQVETVRNLAVRRSQVRCYVRGKDDSAKAAQVGILPD